MGKPNQKKPRNKTYFENQFIEEKNKVRELKSTIEFMKKCHVQEKDQLKIIIKDLNKTLAHLRKKK